MGFNFWRCRCSPTVYTGAGCAVAPLLSDLCLHSQLYPFTAVAAYSGRVCSTFSGNFQQCCAKPAHSDSSKCNAAKLSRIASVSAVLFLFYFIIYSIFVQTELLYLPTINILRRRERCSYTRTFSARPTDYFTYFSLPRIWIESHGRQTEDMWYHFMCAKCKSSAHTPAKSSEYLRLRDRSINADAKFAEQSGAWRKKSEEKNDDRMKDEVAAALEFPRQSSSMCMPW